MASAWPTAPGTHIQCSHVCGSDAMLKKGLCSNSLAQLGTTPDCDCLLAFSHRGRHPTVGNACSNFAAVLASLGKKEEAMEQLQRAKEAWEDSFGDQAAAAKVAALQARVDHQLAKHEKSLQKEPEAADKPLAGPAAE